MASANTSKSTGAAAKSARQAKLSVVRDEQPTTETPQATITEQLTPVADLKAQRAALDAQIKAAKANQPAKQPKPEKPTKTLQDVIAQQTARPRTDVPRIVTTYVLQRQAAGQDLYEALDQVLAQMRSVVLGALDAREPGESYHAAIYRFLGRTDMLAQPSDDTSDEQ